MDRNDDRRSEDNDDGDDRHLIMQQRWSLKLNLPSHVRRTVTLNSTANRITSFVLLSHNAVDASC